MFVYVLNGYKANKPGWNVIVPTRYQNIYFTDHIEK